MLSFCVKKPEGAYEEMGGAVVSVFASDQGIKYESLGMGRRRGKILGNSILNVFMLFL